MTIEEAIAELLSVANHCRCLYFAKFIETCRICARLLKKRIPKKVLFEDRGYDVMNNENVYGCICPACGLEIITFTDEEVIHSENDEPEKMFHDCFVHHSYIGLNNFCNRCGQALDWGDYK